MNRFRRGLEWLGSQSDRKVLHGAAWVFLGGAAVAGFNAYSELSEAHVLNNTRQAVVTTADPQFAGYLNGEIQVLDDAAAANGIEGTVAAVAAAAAFTLSRRKNNEI